MLGMLLILPVNTTIAQAYTIEKLDVSSTLQEKSNWCWAASTQATANCIREKRGLSQNAIVRSVKGTDVNERANSDEMIKALSNDRISSKFFYRSFTFDEVMSDINKGRPIIAAIKSPDKSSSHDVVVFGYQEPDDNSESENIYYMDPWDGSKKLVEYSYFLNNNTFYWDHTYGNNQLK